MRNWSITTGDVNYYHLLIKVIFFQIPDDIGLYEYPNMTLILLLSLEMNT